MVLPSGFDRHQHFRNSFENEKRGAELLRLDGLHPWMDSVLHERSNRFDHYYSLPRRWKCFVTFTGLGRIQQQHNCVAMERRNKYLQHDLFHDSDPHRSPGRHRSSLGRSRPCSRSHGANESIQSEGIFRLSCHFSCWSCLRGHCKFYVK